MALLRGSSCNQPRHKSTTHSAMAVDEGRGSIQLSGGATHGVESLTSDYFDDL